MIYKWVLYIARNRYIEVPSLHRKVLIISIFLAKNLHMSKKSSTFALEIKTKAACQPSRLSDCKTLKNSSAKVQRIFDPTKKK